MKRLYPYLLHWMIADPQETYVVEIVTNSVVARKMDIMTNFNLNWDNENKCAIDDDYVAANEGWTRADYPKPYDTNNVSLAQVDTYYTPHADGVERFCVMRDHYDDGRTFEGMFSMLRRVQYTLLGDEDNRPIWISDLAEGRSITDLYGQYRTNTVALMASRQSSDRCRPSNTSTGSRARSSRRLRSASRRIGSRS